MDMDHAPTENVLCKLCGLPISHQRIQASPHAERCIVCQREFDTIKDLLGDQAADRVEYAVSQV